MANPEDLGRYRLKRLLGRGALGQVWEATERDEDGARVAVKIMHAADEALTLARIQFAREARLAALLRHPNVVRVHDSGEAAGTSFMVMEMVEGTPLRKVMRDASTTIHERLRWLREIGEGLAALHAGNVVHRDLKPENVIIRPDRRACIVDLGVAKWRKFDLGGERDPLELDEVEPPASAISDFVPPEAADAQLYDELGDQYAWGALGDALLADDAPAGVAEVIERARSRDRERRWESMDHLLEALSAGPGEPPPRSGSSSPSRTATTESPPPSGGATATAEASSEPGWPSLASETRLWSRPVSPLPFFTRLWFAWVVFFKVLFDGLFAAKVYAPELEAPKPERRGEPEKIVVEKVIERVVEKTADAPPSTDAALQLLALLQREGRLVDFLEEDVAGFSDADIGAAARVVHGGCRKALRDHVKLEPVRSEDEGAKVTLAEASPNEVKLTGNVQGKGPHTGVLRHRGWRAVSVQLPTAVTGHDARVVAQAEVEL
jgi:predicted Ser/Thr protein kinase